jgi:hypothetical protein
MRPIQTWYDGTLYESLLEARWAVFFDNAGIPYEYEYYGHKMGELGETWYLPDFWLPEQRYWVEVKPHSDFASADINKVTHFEQALRNKHLVEKIAKEENTDRHRFYIFVGSPYFNGKRHTYKVFEVAHSDRYKELYDKGLYDAMYDTLSAPAESASELKVTPITRYLIDCPLCKRLSLATGFGQVRGIYDKAEEERVLCRYCNIYEPREGEVKHDEKDNFLAWCDDIYVSTTRLGYILGSPRLMKGYKAARAFKAPRKGGSS